MDSQSEVKRKRLELTGFHPERNQDPRFGVL